MLIDIYHHYAELNNQFQQKEYFASQVKRFEEGDAETNQMDKDFFQAPGSGILLTGGMGIGIDGLFLLLTDSQWTKEILTFPVFSPRKQNQSSKFSDARSSTTGNSNHHANEYAMKRVSVSPSVETLHATPH